MLSEQRHQEIINILARDGSVKTTTLCKKLSASRETVRRDLEYLETNGRLKRIHGGAMRVETQHEDSGDYVSFEKRKSEHSAYKEEVALEAAQHISEGQVIALDSGTTALELARVIKNRFHSLTVISNSLMIANELADAKGITLILTGGVYNREENAFLSDMATLILSKVNIDVLFLTTCGISAERGITYQRVDDLIIQNKLVEASDKTIVITDSSKLGKNSLVRMSGIEEVSMIITDSHADPEQIERLEQAGVEVVVAKERTE